MRKINSLACLYVITLSLYFSGMSVAQDVPSSPARQKNSQPAAHTSTTPAEDWRHWVRVGAYSLGDNQDAILENAKRTNVFGIEVDNDITGRYDSFLAPDKKLEQIKQMANKAHAEHNRAFVYIAGLECITSTEMKLGHTLAEDHPDWVQRDINGKPAVFHSGAAFWIKPGDEDVWLSPYAPEWRKRYMDLVRRIAATGIDGVYVDIPYWMTHFSKWEDTWASFDDHTVAAFRARTGLDARKDLKLGDFTDAHFRAWVDFRIQTIVDFMHEIDSNVKAVNPNCATIPEIYPGIEESAPRVGADVYELYPVVDAIAHEYEFGNGNHTSANRTPLDWLEYMVGMYSFRAFAGNKPTWILNYSWDGESKVSPGEAMQNLFVAELMTGSNVWDASRHVMSGSNDQATRTKVYKWIKQHERTFYSPRTPIDPIGVYFSPATRNYAADQFIASYRGILMLLMRQHREFQIVTPRTLADYRGRVLVLPDVRNLGSDERAMLQKYVSEGKRLIITGTSAMQFSASENVLQLPNCPGKAYASLLEKDFDKALLDNMRFENADVFLDAIGRGGDIEVTASPYVVAQIASVNDQRHVFLTNFKGLRASKSAVQDPEIGARISLPKGSATTAYFLPFLGETRQISGKTDGDKVIFVLPDIQKGAVVWFE